MKTAGELVTDVSSQLNDQYDGREFQRWSRAQLFSYLNGGFSELLAHKPEAFTRTARITLSPGNKQVLQPDVIVGIGTADEYIVDEELIDTITIIGVVSNANGGIVGESDLDLLRAFSPFSCCSAPLEFDSQNNPVYAAKSYAIDPKNPRVFYISPPVPTGLTPGVDIDIILPPEKFDESDSWDTPLPVAQKYYENLLDYMMGRAFDIDMESALSRSNADRHLSRFYTAMGVKYKIESAFRAGNYNGSIGDGDPRARIQ